MANVEHLAVLGHGIRQWNDWRKENQDVRPNLAGADLDMADLSGADLYKAHLRGTNLRRADLSRANLSRANLSGANLRGANLSGADLRGSNLGGADLSGVELSEANLTGASLYETNLNGALLGETVFGNVDLTNIQGLDTCKHWGASIVDHRTLLRSHHLSQSFLEGCGLPDFLLSHLSILLNRSPSPLPGKNYSIALLRIEIEGQWSAGELGASLASLSELYELRLVLALIHEDITRARNAKNSSTDQFPYLKRILAKQLPHLIKDHRPQLLQLVEPEKRLVVRNVSSGSPGSIEVAGLLTVITHLRDFVIRLNGHRSSRNAHKASKTIDEIENARILVSLGSELSLTDDDLKTLIDYVLCRQAPMIELVERHKIQSVKVIEKATA